jgi:hypothetical protein
MVSSETCTVTVWCLCCRPSAIVCPVTMIAPVLEARQRRSATLLSLCRSISAPWRWSEPMNEIEPPTLRFSDVR